MLHPLPNAWPSALQPEKAAPNRAGALQWTSVRADSAECSKQVTQHAKDANFAVRGIRTTHKERNQGVQFMNWNTPVVVEVCAGMEVTAYLSAQM